MFLRVTFYKHAAPPVLLRSAALRAAARRNFKTAPPISNASALRSCCGLQPRAPNPNNLTGTSGNCIFQKQNVQKPNDIVIVVQRIGVFGDALTSLHPGLAVRASRARNDSKFRAHRSGGSADYRTSKENQSCGAQPSRRDPGLIPVITSTLEVRGGDSVSQSEGLISGRRRVRLWAAVYYYETHGTVCDLALVRGGSGWCPSVCRAGRFFR